MPIAYTVDITNAVGTVAVTAAPTVLCQLTLAASKPIRLKRIELSSNMTGSTQSIVQLQLGTYSSGTAGGTTITPKAVDRGITTAALTAVKAVTTTMGTTFAALDGWQWNGANPFDMVFGLTEIQYEFPVSAVVALIIETAPTAFTASGKLTFEEFG